MRATHDPATRAYGSAAVCGIAAVVSAVAAGRQATALQHGAAAAAMLALAACTALTGRTASRLRRVLLAFSLFLAACALVELAAGLARYPGPPAVGSNGCPIDTDAITAYWRRQLHLGQLAEALRFLALTCATWAVIRLPRPAAPYSWREHAFTTLLPVPAVLYGLAPFNEAADARSLLPVTAPALLSLLAGAALTVLTTTRGSGRRLNNALLVVGAALLTISAADAVGALALLYRQLPDPGPATTFMLCTTAELPGPSAPQITATVAGRLVLLAAPAMFTWSALQPRNDGK